jgi:hypothetical protein
MKGFTKCENGHYYKEELASCPYCNPVDKPTQVHTQIKNDNKTRVIVPNKPNPISNRTVFGDDVIAEIEGREVVEKKYRSTRKLVGWLVTYSHDKMGMDFRL